MNMARTCNRIKSERGTALIEAALTIPLILLVSVAIFEFGRAFETWQIMTNAAREGARVAVLPGSTTTAVTTRVQDSLRVGLADAEVAKTTIQVQNDQAISLTPDGSVTASGSRVIVSYPFQFIVLNGVAQLVVRGSTMGQPITLTTSAVMRNETQF
jgi:Flp pilus assembly protein TadG